MTNKNNNLATSFLRQRASWLAVVPIALLQLTIAFHQFDHFGEYIDGSCHVCVQLDRVDLAADGLAETAPQLAVDFLDLGAPPVLAVRELVRYFNSRAPPILRSSA